MSKNSDAEQMQIDGTITVGTTEVHAVTDDADRDEVGWVISSTIGNDFVVPYDELQEQASNIGLSHALLCDPPSEKKAFTRAGTYVDRRDVADVESHEDVEVALHKEPYEHRYEVELHDRREENEFDGKMLGVIWYESDHGLRGRPQVDPNDEFWDAWNAYVDEFRTEWELQQESVLGKDIRSMIVRFFKHKSKSVKFRAGGGVYFVPVAAEPVVRALDELVSWVNVEHKDAGFPCEFDMIEVADTEEKRSMVEDKVRRNLEEQVSDMIEESVEELAEETEATVSEMFDELKEDLADAEDFAERYNALLDADMAVSDILEDWKSKLSGEAEELVDEALAASN